MVTIKDTQILYITHWNTNHVNKISVTDDGYNKRCQIDNFWRSQWWNVVNMTHLDISLSAIRHTSYILLSVNPAHTALRSWSTVTIMLTVAKRFSALIRVSWKSHHHSLRHEWTVGSLIPMNRRFRRYHRPSSSQTNDLSGVGIE